MRRNLNSFCALVSSAALLVAACTAPAAAQSYPARPIHLIVGFPPGGGADLMARALAARVAETLGQPVVIENRPGANGNLAAGIAATSPADGYTILSITVSHAISQSVYSNLRYSLERDFTPLAHLGRVSQVVVVNPATKMTTINDFLAQAKAYPGSINYGTSGNGSGEHIAGAMLEQMAGIRLTHVPFKGGSDAMAAVVGGHTQASITTLVAANNFVKLGQLRPLAVTAFARSRLLPDVPTVSEATGIAGYEMYTWYGAVMRAGTPTEIVARLNAEINKALRHPETLKVLDNLAVEPTGGTAEQFGALIRSDIAKFARVAKAANVKLD